MRNQMQQTVHTCVLHMLKPSIIDNIVLVQANNRHTHHNLTAELGLLYETVLLQ